MSFEQAVVQLEQTNSKLQEEVVRFRDAAMGLNAIYSTITEGRQNTADGKYFSVPGNGAYMRLYRRQGSSAELIAEFPDRNELNSVIDQLGPLLGRGVVGGAGDLLANGAYGLGGQGYLLTDFDAPPDRNEFYTGAGTSATGNVAGEAYWPGIDLYRNSSDRGVRLMFNTNTMTIRGWTAEEVSGEFSLYSNKNILGTVSQEAGIPTGAIIERGSNANGEYVKLAGGTLMCFIRKAFPDGTFTAEGPVFSTPSFSIIFPAGFVGERPTVSFGCSFGAAGAWAGLGDSGTNYLATSIKAYKLSAGSANAIADVIAMGRWY